METTVWPDYKGTLPRPSVVAIRKFVGGAMGA